jgi:hypothetical protein
VRERGWPRAKSLPPRTPHPPRTPTHPSPCRQTGATAGIACPTGFFSSGGQMTCTLCPMWTRSRGAGDGCDPCPAGFNCTTDPRTALAPCPTGHWSPLGAQAFCTPCPAGSSCSDASVPPVPCAAGFYSAGMATGCTQCPAGSYCVSGASVPQQCPAGSFAAGAWVGAGSLVRLTATASPSPPPSSPSSLRSWFGIVRALPRWFQLPRRHGHPHRVHRHHVLAAGRVRVHLRVDGGAVGGGQPPAHPLPARLLHAHRGRHVHCVHGGQHLPQPHQRADRVPDRHLLPGGVHQLHHLPRGQLVRHNQRGAHAVCRGQVLHRRPDGREWAGTVRRVTVGPSHPPCPPTQCTDCPVGAYCTSNVSPTPVRLAGGRAGAVRVCATS